MFLLVSRFVCSFGCGGGCGCPVNSLADTSNVNNIGIEADAKKLSAFENILHMSASTRGLSQSTRTVEWQTLGLFSGQRDQNITYT